ncbi:MAG: NAD(P)H-dependent oxidoreductase, partial [Lactobacillus iners]|nr:NAD(P)H-dependent oxidoreductase [Lactobacillus iners]
MKKDVVVLVGSLREQSYARKIAKNAIDMFNDEFYAEIVEIRDLPLYDADYDDINNTNKPLPESYVQFRKKIKDAAGVLF